MRRSRREASTRLPAPAGSPAGRVKLPEHRRQGSPAGGHPAHHAPPARSIREPVPSRGHGARGQPAGRSGTDGARPDGGHRLTDRHHRAVRRGALRHAGHRVGVPAPQQRASARVPDQVINEERPMSFSRSTLLVLLALALASPAAAHHRQTPPLVRLTTSGDTPLPRIASPGNKTIALIVDSALGKKVVSISPWRDKRQLTGCSSPVPTSCNLETRIADAGDNAAPAVSISGRAFAFDSGSDPLQTGLPGRQVIGALKTQLREVSEDPTGTSVNPTIDATGMVVAFESTGDLAGTGNPGARQIFLSGRGGTVTQVSQGLGTSRNPVLSAKQNLIAFESSSDPKTGADTGIAQIWVGSTVGGWEVPVKTGTR